ncbi:SDR family oxidoreductase [Listeria sp. FSL L7-1582]|uniref:SDR family oxidoreductase n=1 Tax=Listeria portnoyi TaxID=2713504 RepID=UPI00164D8B4C|nr:SDR family oxidoreductase [Listeria portnoyi]MBC6310474.1 SDR family oxidoreductase [Listeria portnoyi]
MNKATKITLITGANRGIGLQLAKEIGKHGHHILVGARSSESGQNTIEELKKLGITAYFVQLDVTDQHSIQQAVKTIEQDHGYLSVLINNAGIALDNFEQPSTMKTEIMRKDFDVNFFGTVDTTQAMLPLLKKSGQAKIINISSMMGSLGAAVDPNSQIYNVSAVGYQASKAALNMFTIRLAKELEKLEDVTITVNAIDPGMVATEFGGGTPDAAKKMGAKPVEEGVKRTVKLAIDEENNTNITFSNTSGIVSW